jgi:hypothetical protein
MNKIFRSAYWALPSLFLLILVFISSLSGCHPGGGGEPDINKDSVKPHILPIGIARQYTANFRAYIDTLNKHCINPKDSAQFGHAEAFNIESIRTLLAQVGPKGDSAVGVRIYYGRDNSTGQIKLILVPYDKHNNDIINVMIDLKGQPATGASPAHVQALTATDDGQTIENGQHCPTICDDGSSGLNGGN